MAVPVMNYAALPVSGNPFYANLMPSMQQAMALGAQPFQQSAELEKQKLANALAKVQLQYAPQMNQADLGYKQAQTGLANEQAKYFGPTAESEIRLRGAQTGLTNQQSKYLPLDTLIKAIQSQNSQTRFGTAYQQSKSLSMMDKAPRDKWIADNQAAYTDMINTLGNKSLQQQASQGNDMLSNAIAQYYPGLANKQPLPQTPGAPALLQQNAPAPMTVPIGAQPQQPQFGSTPDQIASLANISNMAANQHLTTAATRRQAEGAQQFDSVVNDPALEARAQNAFQYAGIQNKPKQIIDSFNRSNPKAYEDYVTFINNDLPFMDSRIKALDQIGATDKQRELLENLSKKTMFAISSNSPRAAELWKSFKESVNNVNRAVLKSAQPIGDTGRYSGGSQQAPSDSNYSDEDIKSTAQKHGISEDEVRRRIKEKIGGV